VGRGIIAGATVRTARVEQEYRPAAYSGKRYYEPSGHGEESEKAAGPDRSDGGSGYDAPTHTEENG